MCMLASMTPNELSIQLAHISSPGLNDLAEMVANQAMYVEMLEKRPEAKTYSERIRQVGAIEVARARLEVLRGRLQLHMLQAERYMNRETLAEMPLETQ